jgi:polar amino acid transport system substrate-binding protein
MNSPYSSIRTPPTYTAFASESDDFSATGSGPVTAYAVKQSGGKLQLAGQIFDSAPYGWPVAKGSPLGQALQKAAQSLIDSGAYLDITKKWGVEAGAIKSAQINGATS